MLIAIKVPRNLRAGNNPRFGITNLYFLGLSHHGYVQGNRIGTEPDIFLTSLCFASDLSKLRDKLDWGGIEVSRMTEFVNDVVDISADQDTAIGRLSQIPVDILRGTCVELGIFVSRSVEDKTATGIECAKAIIADALPAPYSF